jgi:hypothetical protein
MVKYIEARNYVASETQRKKTGAMSVHAGH